MARPEKKGLDYFQFDVNTFGDSKVEFVGFKYGLAGDGVFVRLLCKLWREGYALKFGEDEALIFAHSVGDMSQVRLILDVVQELLERGFFDKGMYERHGVLTSATIQKRYLKVCREAKRKGYGIEPKYCLLEIPVKTGVTSEDCAEETPQSKAKESKSEQSISDSCAGAAGPLPQEPPVISLILNDKSLYHVTQGQVDRWRELYPAVDVMQQLRHMADWCENNPVKRKTRGGIARFISSWLRKEQDEGSKPKQGGGDGRGYERRPAERIKDTWLDRPR